MYDVMQTTYVTDVDKLMKLLVLFSPGVPNCCNEVMEVVGAQAKVIYESFSSAKYYLPGS